MAISKGTALFGKSSKFEHIFAISFGLKVIIAGSRTNITKNNLKDIVEEYNWKVCYNSEDVLEFINKNIKRVDYDILSFFNSVNRENVNNFLSK